MQDHLSISGPRFSSLRAVMDKVGAATAEFDMIMPDSAQMGVIDGVMGKVMAVPMRELPSDFGPALAILRSNPPPKDIIG